MRTIGGHNPYDTLHQVGEEGLRVRKRLCLLFPDANFRVWVPETGRNALPLVLMVQWTDGPSEKSVGAALRETNLAGSRLPEATMKIEARREYGIETRRTVESALRITVGRGWKNALPEVLRNNDLYACGTELHEELLAKTRPRDNVVSLAEARTRKEGKT